MTALRGTPIADALSFGPGEDGVLWRHARRMERDRAELVEALAELHAIDERKLSASKRRTYRIGYCTIQARVERNRALLARIEKEK